jgi:ABC-type dipeptide/oligopeptide/nickel transport system ATPase subunit
MSAVALSESRCRACRAGVLLQVRDLSTHFPTRTGIVKAVDGISFDVERGKTLCVVGESGSGKSVTARSILQIVDEPGRIVNGSMLLRRADGSSVDLARLNRRGREIRAVRGAEIAMIFQEPMSSLSPVHTVGNQITEVLRLHLSMNGDQARARCIELLDQVEIPFPEKAVDRYTFEFSGGMRQRAMIAMALACNPSLLIADEPTTALDVTTQAEILDLISQLQKSHGMAVMFITHDMGRGGRDRRPGDRDAPGARSSRTDRLMRFPCAGRRLHEDADRFGHQARAHRRDPPGARADRQHGRANPRSAGPDDGLRQREVVGEGRRQRLAQPVARRVAGHRRRIGFRQDHDGPLPAACLRTECRDDRLSPRRRNNRRYRHHRQGDAEGVPARDADDLPGSRSDRSIRE